LLTTRNCEAVHVGMSLGKTSQVCAGGMNLGMTSQVA
jgi:hypothetical protein